MGLKAKCLIRQLKLYLDSNNLIPWEGCIHNAPEDFSVKFPLLLTKKDKLTELIVIDTHPSHLHAGLSNTVTLLRQAYWILSIRHVEKSILQKCVTCKKVTGHRYKTGVAPPLPCDRLEDSIPFSVT